jgi:integrase
MIASGLWPGALGGTRIPSLHAADAWLFDAPEGGPLRESNWKRSVGWRAATVAAGLAGFRVHDLRHTAASVWLGAGADPKVVQRVLGHATASMTVDLYGHLVDANLWQAARLVGDISGTFEPPGPSDEEDGKAEADGTAW